MKKNHAIQFSFSRPSFASFTSFRAGFELKEEWGIEGGVKYQGWQRFFNLTMVMKWILKSWICQKNEKIEWTVSLDGQDQTVNFLGQEKDKVQMGVEGALSEFLCTLWLQRRYQGRG